jgi:hypothetical protein
VHKFVVIGFSRAIVKADGCSCRRHHGAIRSNLPSGDTSLFIPKNIALDMCELRFPVKLLRQKISHTAAMFMNPRMLTRIPEETTIRQNERPRYAGLIACLLRFPRIATPRVTIDAPRQTNPDVELSKGQLREK